MKPKFIVTDFSLAIISRALKEYNNQNIKEYWEICFKIIIDKEEMPSNINFVSVSSAQLSRGIKYFIEKSHWYHRNETYKKKIVLRSLGHFSVCTDFSIARKIYKSAYLPVNLLLINT